MSTAALTEAVFYILLSLDAPLHGYGTVSYTHLFPFAVFPANKP